MVRGWRGSENVFITKASTFYHKGAHASTSCKKRFGAILFRKCPNLWSFAIVLVQ